MWIEGGGGLLNLDQISVMLVDGNMAGEWRVLATTDPLRASGFVPVSPIYSTQAEAEQAMKMIVGFGRPEY